MIISASRRTDIPAFHAEWMMQRLRLGEVLVPNPMRPSQVSRIALDRDSVDAIVFWTKNPAPLLRHLDAIERQGYAFYFLFTLNPYGPSLEPGVPRLEERLACFRALARRLGAERVVWRYDPIVLTPHVTASWHEEAFGRLAASLRGFTTRCIFSFLDDYRKIRSRMRPTGYQLPQPAAMEAIAGSMAATARKAGISLATCSEALDLTSLGITKARCIDPDLITLLTGKPAPTRKDPRQRPHCHCIPSRDIGTYTPCPHHCLYCYAS